MATDNMTARVLYLGKEPIYLEQRIFPRLRAFGISSDPVQTLRKFISNSVIVFSSKDKYPDNKGDMCVTQVLRHPKNWHFILGTKNGNDRQYILGIERRNSPVSIEWDLIYKTIDDKEQLVQILPKTKTQSQQPITIKSTTAKTPSIEETPPHDDHSLLMHVGGEIIEIDDHAVVRFIQRTPDFTSPHGTMPHPIRKLKELFSRATLDTSIDNVQRVRRFLNNGFVEAEYWRTDTWRFVVLKGSEKRKVLKTVERVFKKQEKKT